MENEEYDYFDECPPRYDVVLHNFNIVNHHYIKLDSKNIKVTATKICELTKLSNKTVSKYLKIIKKRQSELIENIFYYKINDKKYEIYKDDLENYELNLWSACINEISIPDNVTILDCNNNQLTSIICNYNLIKLDCFDNRLTSIICNENLKFLYCWNNKLDEFICNENLVKLNCMNNKIKHIKINDKLEELNCDAISNLDEYFNNQNLTMVITL